MKKFLFNGFILAAVCFGSLGIQKNLMSSNSSLSGLMLENVEALTSPEMENSGTYGKGWKQGTTIQPCNDSVYYQCEYSGNQQDYCTQPC